MAVAKGQLGTVRLFQKRFSDALKAHQEARDIFSRLNEPSTVAISWHQIGMVHDEAGQPEAAEEAYNQALAIDVRLGNQAGQASTLGALGNLYQYSLQRPEQAVTFYRRAAEIFRAFGDTAEEGRQLHNQANALRKLKRLEEARTAISGAIKCTEACGHTLTPWICWHLLAAIETEAGNPSAAAKAGEETRDAYLAYRREGGENQSASGRLAKAIWQGLATGSSAEAASLLQQLAADPDFANQLPFLTALQAITAGSRDRSLADDPRLDYTEATEVLLLIEGLEAEVDAAGLP